VVDKFMQCGDFASRARARDAGKANSYQMKRVSTVDSLAFRPC